MKFLTIATLLFSLISSTQAQKNSARIGFEKDNTKPVISFKGGASEGFEDVNGLVGWTIDNQSQPVGASDWFQGNELVFNAQSGSNNSYIAANFSNSAGNDICNWLIMPDLGFLQTLSFWTRTTVGSSFADRMLVLRSPSGGVNTGDCINSFGDFTETVIEINPTLSSGGYPESWTEFSSLIDATGRIAFVYFVEDTANNGNYIGIDNVQWVSGLPESDLEMISSYSPTDNLQIGDAVTVSNTVLNNGPRDANSVQVNINIPEGLEYVSNSCGATININDLAWMIGGLTNSASVNCQVELQVAENGQYFYQASVSGAEQDPNLSNNISGYNIIGPALIIPVNNWLSLILLGILIVLSAFRLKKVKSQN